MSETQLAAPSETEMKLVSAVEKCHVAADMKNDTIKSLRLAAGMNELRLALEMPEITQLIMGYQNIPIGFLTDNKNGYPKQIVLNCALEALTAGAYLHGNEWNIIASRTYFAQNFFVRKIREYCQANQVERFFSYETKKDKPVGKQFEFIVKVTIAWKFPNWEEKKTTMQKYYLLGMTRDQVEGKAKKRAHQWLYNELTDNNFAIVPDDMDTFDMPVEEEISAAPNQPSFNEEPDVIKYLVDRYDVDGVCGFFDAADIEWAPSPVGEMNGEFIISMPVVSPETEKMIRDNLADFKKQIEDFKKI